MPKQNPNPNIQIQPITDTINVSIKVFQPQTWAFQYV